MGRNPPINITCRKHGRHWALAAEDQLLALTVYRKGAATLEALLRGLVRLGGRQLFRQALREALVTTEIEKAEGQEKPGNR
jgi:hypothetical protein